MTDPGPCLRCSRPAGYNRVVVDEVTDTVAGGFCRRCELEEFGRALDAAGKRDDQCILCERDGHYTLPAWVPDAVERTERGLVVCGDFDRQRTAARLCDRHLSETTRGEGGRDAPPRREANQP